MKVSVTTSIVKPKKLDKTFPAKYSREYLDQLMSENSITAQEFDRLVRQQIPPVNVQEFIELDDCFCPPYARGRVYEVMHIEDGVVYARWIGATSPNPHDLFVDVEVSVKQIQHVWKSKNSIISRRARLDQKLTQVVKPRHVNIYQILD